ncbi:hypothetical protein LXA43DRAFT_900608, partial [Ganoderma leucocontextum]
LLKSNEATELCAINGAEANIVGWDSHHLPDGKEVLDTLFVKLHNPPRPAQLPGLPENVIPLAKAKNSIRCLLPIGDLYVTVQRKQVMVLPNFAMTDFASQGRTRPYNVTHLKHCQNHQSIYTCLSRSTSLAQTIIIGMFPTGKLQHGLSPNLRREFQELKLLDYITALRSQGHLPSIVEGGCRGTLLKSFRNWKGHNFAPEGIHPALDWTHESDDPFTLSGPSRPTLVHANIFPDTESTLISNPKKHPHEQWEAKRAPKPPLASPSVPPESTNEPFCATGLIWDSTNYSCGYDAFLTVVWNTYRQQGDGWLRNLNTCSTVLSPILNRLSSALTFITHLETTRNLLHAILFSINSTAFPSSGPCYTAIGDIIEYCMMHRTPFASATCTSCNSLPSDTIRSSQCSSWLLEINTLLHTFPTQCIISSQTYINTALIVGFLGHCQPCDQITHFRLRILTLPPLLCLEVPSTPTIHPDLTISIPCGPSLHSCRLVGILYAGGNHFTARYINTRHHVWYYDGIQFGRQCVYEGHYASVPCLTTCRDRIASHFIYASMDEHS